MSVTLAADYAVLILSDDKQTIEADKIVALTKAAGIAVPTYVADLYAKTLAKKKVESLLSFSAAPVAAAAAPAASAAAPAKAAAPVKEEKKEESDDDMGMGLFD
ncbi:hypothetical protein CYY_009150 [Polysphondylium violaceum]|uniref:60S acidic ribosomal protein P1 n=1 Tax=Polysphondylium violaceum TaxID=133409 RepID=A0A8J4UWB9_9MYCE|nr:hypothetical protein CYY_009150 [Polysphondylium violaceum]